MRLSSKIPEATYIRNSRNIRAIRRVGGDAPATGSYLRRRAATGSVRKGKFSDLALLTSGMTFPYACRWHSLSGSANNEEFTGRRTGEQGISERDSAFPFAAPNPKYAKGKAISMAFRPLHDRVLVRRIEAEAKTAGGIIIPDTAKEKPQEGEIVSVGSGSKAEDGKVTPLDVKAGDRVLFGKWSGTEVKVDGEDLLIMKESDILGIVA